MLPFLKPKKMAEVIITKRKSDGAAPQVEGTDDGQDQGLVAAAEDLIQALTSKDAQAVASALKAAYDLCESMPEEEGPQMNDTDGDQS